MFDVGATGTASLGGKSYTTVFTDLGTRHVKIYLHKKKIGRLNMFRHYIAFAKSHGVTIKTFRTDPAREYICSSLKNHFASMGIQIAPIPPRQQDANGVAERCIGIIKSLARTFIIDAKCPHAYWGRAVLYAAEVLYVLPPVPARECDGKSVFEPKNSTHNASAHELYRSRQIFHVLVDTAPWHILTEPRSSMHRNVNMHG
jgi:hypothetical protein